MASPSSPEVIDVDVDEPTRIVGGTGKPDAPLEIASSDSEDEKPRPAKRVKPARAAAGRRGRAEDGAHRPTGRAGIPEEEGSRAVLLRVSKVMSNSHFWGGVATSLARDA